MLLVLLVGYVVFVEIVCLLVLGLCLLVVKLLDVVISCSEKLFVWWC